MSGRARTVEVAVLGAGPAGVATACALRRLGHTVMLFGRARASALEGLSVRSRALLEYHGLTAAAACAVVPAERGGSWGSAAVSAGHEFIVDRTTFDRALGQDAAGHGIPLEADPALAIELDAQGWWGGGRGVAPSTPAMAPAARASSSTPADAAVAACSSAVRA
jgi:flavin-dependent dehydrogenase